MNKEIEALEIAQSHHFLGDAKGPRHVDAVSNEDGSVSIFVDGSNKETYRLVQKWIDVNGQKIVPITTSVV